MHNDALFITKIAEEAIVDGLWRVLHHPGRSHRSKIHAVVDTGQHAVNRAVVLVGEFGDGEMTRLVACHRLLFGSHLRVVPTLTIGFVRHVLQDLTTSPRARKPLGSPVEFLR